MNATTASCSVPTRRSWAARPRRRLRRTVSDALGLGLLAVTCLALSAQMFTRFPSELQFLQPDAGVAVWFDYGNDGWLDVLCAGGWKGGYGSRMFRNNQDGTFTELNQLEFAGQGDHCFWATVADFNEDGFLDILGNNFVDPGTTDQFPVMYLNRSGTGFTKRLLDRSAIVGGVDARGGGTILDFDQDGLVDIALVGWAVPSKSYLLRNTGAGAFAAIQNTSWTTDAAAYESTSSLDYDGDGVPDLLGMGHPPRLFRNPGGGGFERVTDSLLTSHQNAMSLSSAWGDYDNDGDMDVAVSYVNTATIDLQLFLNDGNGGFTPGFSRPHLCQYVYAVDYDNDGLLDLFVTGFNSRSRLYRNLGAGDFEEILDEPIVQDVFGQFPTAGWGDFDNNGFLDVLVTAAGSTNQLYHNTSNGNHWLRVKLRGQVSNRAAIGAVVRVKATIAGQEVWQMRVVQAQCNSTEIEPAFGLGDATSIDLLRIEWPSGNVEERANVSIDQVLTVLERVRITPARPSASLGASVTLQAVMAGAVQWYRQGELLTGQTNRTLLLTNIVATDAGRYSIVGTSGADSATNHTYVQVDTQFTRIDEGPVVTDLGCSFGSAWGDYDRDGDADLLVGRYSVGLTQLYDNQDEIGFAAVSGLFPEGTDSWFSPILADFDNDSWPDLFVARANEAAHLLFNENGQAFTLVESISAYPWNVSAADYNRDGWLDLYFTSSASARNRLLQNLGGRAFQDMTIGEAGELIAYGTFGGACWADYDDDGWVDVYAPHLSGNRQFLFRNQDGRFLQVRYAIPETGLRPLAGAWGDYDNDEDLDLVVACFGGESVVYRNLGSGKFELAQVGVTITGEYNSASWADYDNDGHLDLFMTWGNAQMNGLFRNNGNGTFTRITTGSLVTDRAIDNAASYNGLWFDVNNDGFLDLYVSNGNDAATARTANYFYRNNPNGNHWLQVRLVGTTSNPQGIGAKVRARASIGGRVSWQRRDITAGDAFNGNQLYAHFGLGDATNVMSLRIEWPLGTAQTFRNVAVNQTLTIVEPRRPVMSGTFAPDGSFQIEVATESGRTYELQASDDLGSWTTTETYTGTGEVMRLTPIAPAEQYRFYRVHSP